MHSLSINNSLQRHREIAFRPVKFKDLADNFNLDPPSSLQALLIKMGPFIAEKDAFRFRNSYPLTEENVNEVWSRIEVYVKNYLISESLQQIGESLKTIKIPTLFGDIPLPQSVIDYIVTNINSSITETFWNTIGGKLPGTYGRCGGMAFAGYDFYQLNWPVDKRFGTSPPKSGVLSNYIFTRLLDSLDLTLELF